MKKSILTLMSIVALFVTSCVQSDVDGVQTVGEETLVSLSVETSSASSRTIADGEKATKLQYAVYDENWNYIYTAEPVTLVDRKTTLELSLLSGTTYNFAFWADADKGYYTPDFPNKKVAVSYAGAEANDESRDAFYGILKVEVKGTTQASVDLKRPFAQVNFGANDLERAKDLGFKADNYTTEFTVSTYETLNFVDGSVEDAVEVTFAAKAPQSETTTLTAGGKDYAWISMNYVLCPAADASLNVCKMVATDGAKSFTVEYPMAPARCNWKTNLVGSLFTDSTKVEVEVTPGTDNDNNVDVPEYENVSNAAQLQQAIDEGKEYIILTDDIDLNDLLSRAADTDPKLVINKGKTFTIDLNSKKLSATSSLTTNPREMFLVKGNLTVVNGTIEYKHIGENMEWNAMTTIFDITDGGVLNLNGVVAKNLGGTDMTFVAHLNNWGEVTLNVENSTLEAPYVAVRVFNSGNDMNNVTIKNSTLKGSRCFWVHNYTLADFGNDQSKVDAHKALLNLDILNGTNTFIAGEGKAPIRYGFTNSIYYDANGNEWVAEGASKDENGNVVIANIKGMEWFYNELVAGNNFAGKTLVLGADIDMTDFAWDSNGANGGTSFGGVLDGDNHTITNLTITASNSGSYASLFSFFTGKVKNLTIDGVTATDTTSGGRASVIGGYTVGVELSNVTVKNAVCTGVQKVAVLLANVIDGGTNVIENCHVDTATLKNDNDTLWQAGAIIGYAGTTNGITVRGCSIKDITLVNAATAAVCGNNAFYCHTFIGCLDYKDANNSNGQPVNVVLENNTISGTNTVTESLNPGGGEWFGYSAVKGTYKNSQYLHIYIDGVEFVADGVSLDAEGNYLISKAAGLTWFSDQINNKKNTFSGKTIKVVNDIDMDGVTYYGGSVNSYPSYSFKGVFDGCEKVISNLTVTVENDIQGAAALIPTLAGDGTTIKNVILKNVNISSSHYAGGIFAYTTSDNCYSIVTNCHVEGGAITGNIYNNDNGDKVGGIGGLFYNGIISGCSVKGVTISGYRDTAGLVGYASDPRANIKNNTLENVTINVNNTNNYKNYTNRAQYDVNSYVGEGVGKAKLEGNTGEATINWGSIAE